MDTSKCRSCGAEIMHVPTGSARPDGRPKTMPLDVNPPDGVDLNVLVDGGVARVVPPGQGTHVSHFASCPQADRWRRRSEQRDLTSAGRLAGGPKKSKATGRMAHGDPATFGNASLW